jgi:arylsulfatase A-like enzyme
VRLLLIAFLLSAAPSVLPQPPTREASAQSRRPNVLLIVTDDQGFGDLGLHGNPTLKTPHLDRLARAGVEFKNFYVSPVCAPTRASLLTGRYHQRTGVRSVTNGYETIAADETTLAEILSAAGYRTALFGKWHLGEYYPHVPHAQGFQHYVGFRTGHTDDYFDAPLEQNGRPYQTQGYITDALTDEAIKFIGQNRRRPFFAYVPYNAPHSPFQAPESYLAKFRALKLPERTTHVYAMLQNLDDSVGRLLAELDRLKLADDTLVIFMSDNGMIYGRNQQDRRYNAGLRDQKFTVYEGGVRVPFFLRPPARFAVRPGAAVEKVAAHIDVLPTVLDYCGVRLPQRVKIDGVSLRPLIEKGERLWPERTLYMNYSLATLEKPAPYPGGFARTERYKLVNGAELYDLAADPGEQRNIAAERPELTAELDRAYRQWWREVTAERGFGLLPIQIGHAAENPVAVAMHHARATGGLKFEGVRDFGRLGFHPVGVDGDWVTNWKSTADSLAWELEVTRGGRYEISAEMRRPVSDAGSRVRFDFGGITLDATVPAADTVKGEWQIHKLGALNLKAGRARLTAQALSIKGQGVWELRRLLIKRL